MSTGFEGNDWTLLKYCKSMQIMFSLPFKHVYIYINACMHTQIQCFVWCWVWNSPGSDDSYQSTIKYVSNASLRPLGNLAILSALNTDSLLSMLALSIEILNAIRIETLFWWLVLFVNLGPIHAHFGMRLFWGDWWSLKLPRHAQAGSACLLQRDGHHNVPRKRKRWTWLMGVWCDVCQQAVVRFVW